jgi:hypothetical protein
MQVDAQKLEKLPAKRNSKPVLRLRKKRIGEWDAKPELDYGKNCVFIDEAGFNHHTQRNYGRLRKRNTSQGYRANNKGYYYNDVEPHIESRGDRYIFEETASGIYIQEEKGK